MNLVPGSFDVFGKPLVLDFTEALFRRVIVEIGKRRKISIEDGEAAKLRECELREGLTKLRSIRDDAIRMNALDTVSAALLLGFYHHGDALAAAEAVAKGRGIAQAKRREKKAAKPAGLDAAQAKNIVWRLTEKLWGSEEEFRGRPTLTAKRIYDDVVKKMSSVVEPSSIWAAPAKDDINKQGSYISRIENHVKTFKRQHVIFF